ncbi:MAG: hypothetical protein AB8C84_07470 [Oligoflexales bacterium]
MFSKLCLCVITFCVPGYLFAVSNLGLVSPHVFRGGALAHSDYEELQSLGVKYVINLQVTPDNSVLCEQNNLECLHFPLMTVPLFGNHFNFGLFYAALQTVLTKRSEDSKVYIHCYHGSDRTGLLSSAVMISDALQEKAYQNQIVAEKIKASLQKHHFHKSFYPNLEKLILSWAEHPPLWLKAVNNRPEHISSWVEAILNRITPLAVWLTKTELYDDDFYETGDLYMNIDFPHEAF